MHILPVIALILIFGLLTGTSFFALGNSLLLLLIQLARYVSHRWSDSIEVKRVMERREIGVGDSVSLGLQITNVGSMTIPWIYFDDSIPKSALEPPFALELVGKSAKLIALGPRKHSLLAYQIRALRRGYFQIGPAVVETGDLVGFHRSFKVLASPEYLLVLPKLIPLDAFEALSRRPVGDLKLEDRGLEDPTLMVGVREYQAGDPINRVHWKATARTGVLHTRIYEPTCMQGAMMVVDMHRKSNPTRNEPVRTDLAVTMAASLAHALYQMGQPFGLVSNGRDAVDRVREIALNTTYTDRENATRELGMRESDSRLRPLVVPSGAGPEHFANLHRTLARLERTDGLSLGSLLAETESRLPRMLSVLVILQELDESDALALGMMRRRGFSVTAIINNRREAMEVTAGLLAANRIPFFVLPDEDSIPHVCRRLVLSSVA